MSVNKYEAPFDMKRRRSSIVPEIQSWRRAEEEDIPQILSLMNKMSTTLYGIQSIENLIQFSVWATVLENIAGVIIAFISLKNYPRIPALLPTAWPDWMDTLYKLEDVQPANTLFVHYLAWSPKYYPTELVPIFMDIFLYDSKVSFIIVVVPPLAKEDQFFLAYLINMGFKRKFPYKFSEKDTTQSLLVLSRLDVLPPVRIRNAIPQDNDELVRILHAKNPKLREIYGDLYISQIISNTASTRRIIVAEDETQCIGMMCLNRKVDTRFLNRNYELVPFAYLRQHMAYPDIENVVKIRYLVRKASETYFQSLGLDEDTSRKEEECNQKEKSCLESLRNNSLSHPADRSNYEVGSQRNLSQNSDNELQENKMAEWRELFQKFQERETYHEQKTKEFVETNAEANVFAIELYGMHDSADERVSYELLKAAFECFYKIEYCLVSFPTTTRMPFLLNSFTRVAPRSQCELNDSLYLVHENSVTSGILVRHVIKQDIDDIKKLILYGGSDQIPPAEDMMDIIYESLKKTDKKQHDVLVVLSMSLLVGFIILEPAGDVEVLRLYYDLDRYYNFNIEETPNCHAHIVFAYIAPVFEAESIQIYRELYRTTGYTSFYYKLRSSKDNAEKYMNLYNTLLPTMFPIKPRRHVDFSDSDFLDITDISPEMEVQTPLILKSQPKPFALLYQNVKLSQERMRFVEARIVIIGFGRTSKSFLENLIYKSEYKHVVFTNITVIVEAGVVEADFSETGNLDLLFPFKRMYSANYLRKLELRTWVNFISGSMTKIDRTSKHVIVNENQRVKYDELYLFCGVQFDIPIEVFNEEIYPHNLVLMNKVIDAKIMYHKLQLIKAKFGSEYSFVVYGNNLEAFASVNYLLNDGVSGRNIHFVLYKRTGDTEFLTTFADDEFVENIMEQTLEKFQVQVYKDYRFVTWERDVTDMITTICFESRYQFIRLPCTLFFCFKQKSVSIQTVKALNASSLLFDGRVVIDSNCRTSDPFIFAAGTFTKYKRVLFADNYRHVYYDTVEIGRQLAFDTIKRWDPRGSRNANKNEFSLTIREYHNPIVDKFILPGNFYFLCVKRPGFQIPQHVTKLIDGYGKDYITQSKKDEENAILDYFKVHLDKDDFATSLTCLCSQKFDPYKIIPLWGKHETLLNNLKENYERGSITNFFKFFKSRWVYAICCDRFKDLQAANDKILKSFSLRDTSSSIFNISTNISGQEPNQVSKKDRDVLLELYKQQNCVEGLKDNLMQFLENNKEELFMYARTEHLSELSNTFDI